MYHLAVYFSDWHQYNGQKVVIDGMKCTVHVHETTQYFPYKAKVMHCDVTIDDKTELFYLETKRKLGDDWSYDGFEMADEILTQLSTIPSEVAV